MTNLVFSKFKDSMDSCSEATLGSFMSIDSGVCTTSQFDSSSLKGVVDVNDLIYWHLPSADEVDAIYQEPIDDSLYLGPINSANSPFFEGMESAYFA